MELKLSNAESNPICPFCEHELDTLEISKVSAVVLGIGFDRTIYNCPECKKILGISEHDSSLAR